MPEPNTNGAAAGEALEGRPGSQSVARAAEAARNQGDPGGSRRTNYEGQAGIIDIFARPLRPAEPPHQQR